MTGRDGTGRPAYTGPGIRFRKANVMTSLIVIILFIMFFFTLNIVEKGRWD
ncbi:MAG: hypothetical protein ACWA5T_09355 [Parvularcula sp.]